LIEGNHRLVNNSYTLNTINTDWSQSGTLSYKFQHRWQICARFNVYR